MNAPLIADKLIAQSAAFVQASRERDLPLPDLTQPISRRYPSALMCGACGENFGMHYGMKCRGVDGFFTPLGAL